MEIDRLRDYVPQPSPRKEIKNDSKTYPGSKKGVIYIFNHSTYDEKMGCEDLPATEKDVSALIDVFSDLGFDIKGPKKELKVFNNYTHKNIIKELKKAKDDDYQSIGVIVMSHGSLHEVAAFDESYYVDELIDALKGKFKNKLKFFIIEACRSNEDDDNRFLPDLPENEMLLFHSTYPETEASQHEECGSYFIQVLCKRLSIITEKSNFLDEMTFVRRDVGHCSDGDQMPILNNTMTKHFYIGPEPKKK